MMRLLLCTALVVAHLAGVPAYAATLDEALAGLRANLIAPADSSTMVWLSGKGIAEDMPLTVTARFDNRGRFVIDARGDMSTVKGYNRSEVWEQDPTGKTRILRMGDAQRTLMLHWIAIGYWVHPDAPLELSPSKRRVGRKQMAIDIRFRNTLLAGTVVVDTKRWLPLSFHMTDYGAEMEMRFRKFEEHGQRMLPGEMKMLINGKENTSITFDTFRTDDAFDIAVFAPREDEARVSYSADQQGTVESRRGRWGHHFVRPRINGKDIGWLAFDTGASITMIDGDVADELGLRRISSSTSTGIGGQIEESIYEIESIELGPVRLEDVPVGVLRMSQVQLGLPEGHAGILGMDFLWHCVIDYDQKNSVIGLHDPRSYSLPEGEWDTLLDYNGKPTVTMRFEGHDGIFTIDTGNPGAIAINPMTVERLSLLKGRSTSSGYVGGFGGSVLCERGDLEWVEWGHLRFRDVPAEFILEERGSAADFARDGIIGTDLLERYRIIFDISHGRVAYLSLD